MFKWLMFAFDECCPTGGMGDCIHKGNSFEVLLDIIDERLGGVEVDIRHEIHIVNLRSGEIFELKLQDKLIMDKEDLLEIVRLIWRVSDMDFEVVLNRVREIFKKHQFITD